MKKDKHQMNLGNDEIKGLLFRIGIPIMLGMLFTALDNIGDAFFISKLGVSQLSAILICGPIGQVIVALGLLFGNGAGACLPRLLGAKKLQQADETASTALFGSLLLGLTAVMFIFLTREKLLILLGGTAENMPFAMTYAAVYIPSLLLNIFTVTMNSLNSSEGQARLVLIVNSLTAVLNFVLNPLCIYTLHLGIAGAAYATVIAQGIATLILISHVATKKSHFHYRLTNIRLNKTILAPIFKVGLSTLIFQVLTSCAATLTNIQIKEYGDSAIAAIGAVTRIVSIGTLMVFGFVKGFQTVAGYNFGAKKYDRLNQAIKISIRWTSCFCLFVSLIMLLFPDTIIAQFTTGDLEMTAIGRQALQANSIAFLFFGFYTVYSSLFLALGKTKKGFLLGACRQGFCFIPLILTLPIFLQLKGIIYAQPLADLLSAAITVVMALSLHKELSQNYAVEKTFCPPHNHHKQKLRKLKNR